MTAREIHQPQETAPFDPHSPQWDASVELGPNERILGGLNASAHGKIRMPAWWRRPRVFRGIKEKPPRPPRVPRKKPTIWTAWRWFFVIMDPLLAMISRPVDAVMDYTVERCVYNPLCRVTYRVRDGNPLASRSRGTIAYDLLCALTPRSRVILLTDLEYTTHRLRFLYKRRNQSAEDGTQPIQLGWSTPLNNLSWVRRRKSPKSWRGTDYAYSPYEFGFADGSWITLEIRHASEEQELHVLLSHFPSHVHLSPDEKPSKGLARSLRKEWNA